MFKALVELAPCHSFFQFKAYYFILQLEKEKEKGTWNIQVYTLTLPWVWLERWKPTFEKASKGTWLYKYWTSVWYSDPGSLDLTCIQHASTTASSSAQFIKEWLWIHKQTRPSGLCCSQGWKQPTDLHPEPAPGAESICLHLRVKAAAFSLGNVNTSQSCGTNRRWSSTLSTQH